MSSLQADRIVEARRFFRLGAAAAEGVESPAAAAL